MSSASPSGPAPFLTPPSLSTSEKVVFSLPESPRHAASAISPGELEPSPRPCLAAMTSCLATLAMALTGRSEYSKSFCTAFELPEDAALAFWP
jgi:hypothetical protein